jgi:hypothetical protein
MTGLTDDERAQMNSADTTADVRMRLYAKNLLATSEAYIVAADAPGLRKDAARYLYTESVRLHREAMAAFGRADELEVAGK